MEKSIIAAAIIVILVIVVVAALALYHSSGTSSSISTTINNSNSTGLTNTGGGVLAPGCTSPKTFGCSNATITNSGELSFSMSDTSNVTFYNIHIACIAYNSSTNRPSNSSAWYSLTSLGTAKPANFTGTSLQPGTFKNVASLQCYTAKGMPASFSTGQNFRGLVLVNYTTNSNPVSSGTHWITAGAAAVNVNSIAVS